MIMREHNPVLQASPDRWRLVLENAPDFVLIIDRSGKILFINRFQPGFTLSQVLGASMYDFVTASERRRLEKIVKRVFTTGEAQTCEISGAGPFGVTAWYGCRMAAVKTEGPGVDEVVIFATDITEQKRTLDEMKLLQTITREISYSKDINSAIGVLLKAVCETTGWVIGQAFFPDDENQYLRCAPSWYCSVPGLEKFRRISLYRKFAPGEGLPGRAWSSRQPAWIVNVTEDPNFPRAPIAREVGLKAGYAIPIFVEHETVAVVEFFVLEEREEDTHLLALVSAVSAQLSSLILRKKNESVQREYERRFQEILQNVHLAAVSLDAAGRVTFCNDYVLALTSRMREEVIGQNWFDLFVPSPVFKRLFEEMVKRGDLLKQQQYEIATRYGQKLCFAWNHTVLRDAEGAVAGVASVGEDITERRQMSDGQNFSQNELRTQNELLQATIGRLEREKKALADSVCAMPLKRVHAS